MVGLWSFGAGYHRADVGSSLGHGLGRDNVYRLLPLDSDLSRYEEDGCAVVTSG